MNCSLLIISFLLKSVSCYNYLVYAPLFAHSHTSFMGKLANILNDAGHNVTFFAPVLSYKYRNYEYVQSTVRTVYIDDVQSSNRDNFMKADDLSKYWYQDSSIIQMIPSLQYMVSRIHNLDRFLEENIEVLNELKKSKFDAIIFESFLYSTVIIKDYLEIKVALPVTTVSHDILMSEIIGEPINPSFLSGHFTNFPDKMDFYERIQNLIGLMISKFLFPYPNHKSLKNGKIINLKDLYPNCPFIFVNSNPYIDFARPILPKTIQVGGIQIDVENLKSSKVDKSWDEILNQRQYNFLISFGSLFSSKDMPRNYKSSIIEAMKSLPNVTFIWKYESDDIYDLSRGIPNIYFSKWVPQCALLADKRLSAFLTHGGLGSVTELSYVGKPAILCPIFADQYRNAKMLTRHNGSIELSKFDLPNTEVVLESFKKILFEKSFQKNAETLASQLSKQPVKPRDLLVKYAEFAAEFGDIPAMDPYHRQMTFLEYYMIDIAFMIFAMSK